MAPARARPATLVATTMLLALTLAFAGCTAPAATPDDGRAPAPVPSPAGYRPNLFLLDQPRPVDARVSDGAEPSILADRDGAFLWIGDTGGAYFSVNNGTGWKRMPYFLPPSLLSDGWALAQDATGRLYAGALTGPEIEVGVSEDGTSWAYTTPLAAVSVVTDRPWLAARGDGEVSLIYFDGILGATGLYEACARSTDAGRTWLDLSRWSASPQAGNLVYDDAGSFHFVNSRGVLHSFAGTCLGGAQRVTAFSQLGANNMIQAAADGTHLYTAAAGPGNGEVVLWGKGAATAPKTIVVSPPELKSNTFVTVSAHKGQVAVAWYGSETAGDPSQVGFHGAFNVYVAIVDDFWGKAGGPHVRYVRITDEPNHVGDICMGGIGCGGSADRDLLDYFMLDHDKWGGIHVAYGHDGAGSSAEVRHAHIPPTGLPPAPDPLADAPPFVLVDVHADGLQVTADGGRSSDPEGGALTFAWDMGDGSRHDGALVTHTYDASGAYEIHLTVRDEAQNAVEHRTIVEVEAGTTNQAPRTTASIQPSDPIVGEQVTFAAEGSDPDGDVLTFVWDLGDGTTSHGARTTHSYVAPGAYAVLLTTEDGHGARVTQAATLHVAPASDVPVASPAATADAPGAGVGAMLLVALAAANLLVRRRT